MPIDGARGEAASGLQGRFLEKRRHQKLLAIRKNADYCLMSNASRIAKLRE
jgi:hypothetical protein